MKRVWMCILGMLLALVLCAPGAQAAKRKTKRIGLELGQTVNIMEQHALEGFAAADCKYKSTNPDVLKVDKQGYLYARAEGKATVKVQCEEQTYSFAYQVKKRGMIYPKTTMLTGEKLQVIFTSDVKAASCKWQSDNKKVATVNRAGEITAKGKGKARITGSVNGVTYTCFLTVKKKPASIIYLTFDDGPSAGTTPKILDILQDYDVKATFFEIKPSEKTFQYTKRILKEGHTLAIHGYSHNYYSIYKSEKRYRENVDTLRDYFFEKTGKWCINTRFPGGSSNTVSRYNKGIMSRLTKKMEDWGYRYHDWNVANLDAGGCKTASQAYKNVINGLKKNRENVVLMHDSDNKSMTINSLADIIKYGKAHGYTFLPITDSTKAHHHPVNN